MKKTAETSTTAVMLAAFCLAICTGCPNSEAVPDGVTDEPANVLLTEHIVDIGFEDAFWVFADNLDGDGDVDILGTSHNSNALVWWENTDGEGAFAGRTAIATVSGAVVAYGADLNGDTSVWDRSLHGGKTTAPPHSPNTFSTIH